MMGRLAGQNIPLSYESAANVRGQQHFARVESTCIFW